MCSSSCSLEKKSSFFSFTGCQRLRSFQITPGVLWCRDVKAHSETSFSGANSDRSVRFHPHASWNCWETLHEEIGGCRFGSRPVQTFVLRTDRLVLDLKDFPPTWKKSEALPPSGLLLATQAERIKWSRCFALGCKGWQTAASSHTDPDLWVCSLQESTGENPTFMFHIQTVRRRQPPWRRQRDSKTQKKAGKHHVVNSNSCELLLQKRCFKLHVVKVEVKGRMKRSGCCSERLHPTRPLTVRKPLCFPEYMNGMMGRSDKCVHGCCVPSDRRKGDERGRKSVWQR